MARKIRESEAVEVSLLPEDKGRGADSARKSLSYILWAVLAVLIVGLTITLGYFRTRAGSMSKESAALAGQLLDIESQIGEVEKSVNPVKDMGRRIGLAKSALGSHVSGFPLMEVLEATAIPEVVVKQINADAKGTIVLAGRGKTVNTVIRQILSWNGHPAINEVKISGISNVLSSVGEIEGVEFTATLILDPALFKSSLD